MFNNTPNIHPITEQPVSVEQRTHTLSINQAQLEWFLEGQKLLLEHQETHLKNTPGAHPEFDCDKTAFQSVTMMVSMLQDIVDEKDWIWGTTHGLTL